MKYLKSDIAKLLLGLAVFFNIEILNLTPNSAFHIHPSIYVLGLVVVLATLVTPYFAQQTFLKLSVIYLAVYAALKVLLVVAQYPSDGYAFVTITEVALLMILTYLSLRVARQLKAFENAVSFLGTVNKSENVIPLKKAGDDIRREMTRSRHYNRSMSVITLKIDDQDLTAEIPRIIQEIQANTVFQYVNATLTNLINEETRIIDTIIKDEENNSFLVICPEIDKDGTALLARHIQDVVAQRLGLRVVCGTAAFPEEALTFESLNAKAASKMIIEETERKKAHSINPKTFFKQSQEALRPVEEAEVG